MRADANINRSQLRAAARDAFAHDGLRVPLREIARRADVSPATLYRHFPTKRALALEAFADEMAACRTIVHRACDRSDPWDGFTQLVHQLCEQHSRSRGFTAAFLSTYPDVVDLAGERRQLLAAIANLMRRAQADGRLRDDATVTDLFIMLTAHRAVPVPGSPGRPTASRRFAALTIRAFERLERASQ